MVETYCKLSCAATCMRSESAIFEEIHPRQYRKRGIGVTRLTNETEQQYKRTETLSRDASISIVHQLGMPDISDDYNMY